MKKYFIVAESGADLSPEMIEKYDIRIVQMHVEIDGQDYLDYDVSIKELTGYYDRTGKVPKTAGVNPDQFEVVFNEIKNENPNAVILHLCYSAQLSVGYQSSIIADDGTMKIHRIDIKNVSIGQGLIVLKTARLIEQQPDIEPEELVAWIESLVTRTRFCFVPGNLDYLKAGGRVSNAQYIGAKLLKLKPLIEVIDGLMLSTKKYRGSMDSIITAMMTEYFKKHTIDKELMIFVYACTLDNSLKNTMEQIAKKEGVKNIIWLQTGGVITSHSGPGGVGISGVEV